MAGSVRPQETTLSLLKYYYSSHKKSKGVWSKLEVAVLKMIKQQPH